MAALWQLAVVFHDQAEAVYLHCDTLHASQTINASTIDASSSKGYLKANAAFNPTSTLMRDLESQVCGPLLRDRLFPFATDKANSSANPNDIPSSFTPTERDNRSVSIYGNGEQCCQIICGVFCFLNEKTPYQCCISLHFFCNNFFINEHQRCSTWA